MKDHRRVAAVAGVLGALMAVAITIAIDDVPRYPEQLDLGEPRRPDPAPRSDLVALSDRGTEGPTPELGGASARVPGQLLIRFEEGVGATRKRVVRREIGVELIRSVTPELELVRVPGSTAMGKARRRAARARGIAYAEPNLVYRASASVPNDPLFSGQWALSNPGGGFGVVDADIDATDAWDVATGSDAVTVAVVDSGVAYDHPDLAANTWRNPIEASGGPGVDDDGNGFVDDIVGWDWIDDDADPKDLLGHGTHVGGTIGASGNNAQGITGVNWDVSLMSLRALDAEGAGSTADIASAFHYAAESGARVVNASLGGPGRSQALLDVMAAAPRTLFVVAAGNSGTNNDIAPSYPCNYSLPNVICVAATDGSDQLASFSNFGALSVHIAAPGTRILSTVPRFDDVFADDFGTDLAGRWTSDDGWGRATNGSGYYLSDSPVGDYPNGSNNTISLTQPLDLSRYAECRLSYRMRLEAQAPNDGLVIEASGNGSEWTRVASWSGTTEGGWVPLSDDLSELAGDAEVQLRLRFVSDSSGSMDGADLDDVRIRCLSPDFSNTTFAYYSGTSMATPHVAGAAALLWSVSPSAALAEIKGALLAGADPLPSLVAKTTSGARLNVAGALALVSDEAPDQTEGPPSPSPHETPSPASPEPSPTRHDDEEEPTPSPTPTPSASTAADIEVTLRLRRHLVASGSVGGIEGCTTGIKVRILRNGRVVSRMRTTPDGDYEARVKDARGRYVAWVPAQGDCPGDRSPVVRHRHF